MISSRVQREFQAAQRADGSEFALISGKIAKKHNYALKRMLKLIETTWNYTQIEWCYQHEDGQGKHKLDERFVIGVHKNDAARGQT